MANEYKIENYGVTANTFTFPNNSTSFDDTSPLHSSTTEVPFDNKHISITKGALSPKTLNLQGFFTGTDKLTNWNEFLEMLSNPNIKKFYFATDRFYLVKGASAKQTRTGGRNNFIDYVCSMSTPIPFVFSDTLKTASYDGTTWTDGTETNEGTHQTYIEEVEVTLSGGSSGDTFTIIDANYGGVTITLDSAYVAGDKLHLYLVSNVNTNGYYTTEYWYATFEDVSASTTTQVQRGTATGQADLDLVLSSGQQVNTLTISDNVTSGNVVYSNVEISFRDSWLA